MSVYHAGMIFLLIMSVFHIGKEFSVLQVINVAVVCPQMPQASQTSATPNCRQVVMSAALASPCAH